jgi:hypothetical protein
LNRLERRIIIPACTFLQILPALEEGGVERGAVEKLSRELVRRGHVSTVISPGGRLAEQVERDGLRGM